MKLGRQKIKMGLVEVAFGLNWFQCCAITLPVSGLDCNTKGFVH